MPARKAAETPPAEAENDAGAMEAHVEGGMPASVPPQPRTVTRPAPPYYIARKALFHAGLIRAFNAGDQVPADIVAVNGWTADVTHPDDMPAPAASEHADEAGQE